MRRGVGSLALVALASYVAGRRKGHEDGETGMVRRLLAAGLLAAGEDR